MPSIRLTQFKIDIARALDLIGYAQSLGAISYGRIDASDIYRAAYVQGVSALDSYIHGVVLDRSVDFIMGRLNITVPSNRTGLHFGSVKALVEASTPSDLERLARGSIAQRLSTETFQQPDDIAKALAMVGVGGIWTAAFQTNAGTTKRTLGLIVTRRNKIVHQCDADPLLPGAVTSLSHSDTLVAINEINHIVEAIDQQL